MLWELIENKCAYENILVSDLKIKYLKLYSHTVLSRNNGTVGKVMTKYQKSRVYAVMP